MSEARQTPLLEARDISYSYGAISALSRREPDRLAPARRSA